MTKSEKKRFFRIGDLVACLLVLLLSGALLWAFFAAGRGAEVEIVVDGVVQQRISLSNDASYVIKAEEHTLTVVVEDGSVCVTEADCPDRVCQATGKISKKGAVIVCAPAKVAVRIVGRGDSDVDFIAG